MGSFPPGLLVPNAGQQRGRPGDDLNLGAGGYNCAAWVTAQKVWAAAQQSGRIDDWVDFSLKASRRDSIVAWLQGFLNGLVFASPPPDQGDEHSRVFEPPDEDTVRVWLDNYCRAKPLDSVYKAGVNFAIELRKKHRAR